jgi:hypothetical protein
MLPTPRGTHARLGRDAAGHAIKSAIDGLAVADPSGLAGQHEKCGLKGIVGRVRVAQDAAADTKTIGPCRATSAPNARSAVSSSRVRNRSSI